MKQVLILAALLLAAPFPAAQGAQGAPEPGLVELLAEGEELFHQASNAEDLERAELLYRRALHRYELIARQGVRNAGLYYNIGNAYFRLGDLGRAVLYYRRALLLNPADPNVRHNLVYARSKRADRITADQVSAALRILLFWHYRLPPWLKLGVFVWSFGSAGLLGAFLLLKGARFPRNQAAPRPAGGPPGGGTSLRAPLRAALGAGLRAAARRAAQPAGRVRAAVVKRLTVLRAALAVLGGLSLVMLGSLTADEIRLRTMRDGVIIAREVVARRGDGTAYQPSFVDPLHQGTEFRLLERRAGWYRIRLTDGRTCWIPARAAETVLPGPFVNRAEASPLGRDFRRKE